MGRVGFCLGIGLMAVAAGYALYRDAQGTVTELEQKKEYSRISAMIDDLDGKPGTSFDDWSIVYERTFGRPLDHFRDDPTKLSLEDLRKIDVDKLRQSN